MSPYRALFALALLCAALVSGALAVAAPPQPQAAGLTIYLPRVAKPGQPSEQPPTPQPTQPPAPQPTQPPPANLPSALVGTWFNGKLLNKQFYDPNTQSWQNPGGLAHMYIFEPNGAYTLASYLELKTGPFCVSTVWKYQTGGVRVEGDQLLLTPQVARTRTVIACGSTSDSETEGPYTTTSLPWRIFLDEGGHTKLAITEGERTTEFYKDGLPQQVVGKWRMGEVTGGDFYNPQTQEWTRPVGPGQWYEFNADGTYRHGRYSYEYDANGCQTPVWVYQEGQLSGKGGTITTKATSGLRLTQTCEGEYVEEQWLDKGLGEYAWSLFDPEAAPKLRLITLLPFESRFFYPDQ